jgi:phosphohistidine phosphatase SixA
MRVLLQRLTFIVLALVAAGSPAASNEETWQQLRGGGQVVLMRHAETTPGTGDPAGFRLDDCATQRNLSARGRVDARRIGAALRAHGVRIGEVFTSRWCRAIDTAELAFDRHKIWPELDSLFDAQPGREAQTGAVRRRIAEHRGKDNLFLVGHGSNILALTGIHPSMGGMVVVTPGGSEGFRIVGQLEPDAVLAGQTETR